MTQAVLIVLLAVHVVAFFAVVFFFISSIVSSFLGSPFVPMRRSAIKKILAWATVERADTCIDFGCGDGRVLIVLVETFGVRCGVGYEGAPLPFLLARFAVRRHRLHERITLHRTNFLSVSREAIGDADFVFLYLFPKLIETLSSTVLLFLRPGARVLTVSFPLPLSPAFALVRKEKIGSYTAYLYERQ